MCKLYKLYKYSLDIHSNSLYVGLLNSAQITSDPTYQMKDGYFFPLAFKDILD